MVQQTLGFNMSLKDRFATGLQTLSETAVPTALKAWNYTKENPGVVFVNTCAAVVAIATLDMADSLDNIEDTNLVQAASDLGLI